MNRPIKLLAATLALGIAGAANAQTVDQRHGDQQARIEHGVASGRLTAGEAHRDERQQRSIGREESNMRAVHGGRLTGADRAALQHRESRASHHIYRSKHNGRGY